MQCVGIGIGPHLPIEGIDVVLVLSERRSAKDLPRIGLLVMKSGYSDLGHYDDKFEENFHNDDSLLPSHGPCIDDVLKAFNVETAARVVNEEVELPVYMKTGFALVSREQGNHWLSRILLPLGFVGAGVLYVFFQRKQKDNSRRISGWLIFILLILEVILNLTSLTFVAQVELMDLVLSGPSLGFHRLRV